MVNIKVFLDLFSLGEHHVSLIRFIARTLCCVSERGKTREGMKITTKVEFIEMIIVMMTKMALYFIKVHDVDKLRIQVKLGLLLRLDSLQANREMI